MIHHRIEPQDIDDDYRHHEDCDCDRCTEQLAQYCEHGKCPDDGDCDQCDAEALASWLEAMANFRSKTATTSDLPPRDPRDERRGRKGGALAPVPFSEESARGYTYSTEKKA